MGLIERINSEILHPVGLAMCRNVESGESPGLLISDDGEWTYGDDYEFRPTLTKEQIQEELKTCGGKVTDKQFSFLVDLISKSTRGPAHSELIVNAAYKYCFNRISWLNITESTCNRANVTKSAGKALAEKINQWHGFLADWPSDIKAKFEALEIMGDNAMQKGVINAAIQHVDEGININKASVANGCFYHSVKSALAKIKKYDEAAERYGEL
jgi:hypothetical protein